MFSLAILLGVLVIAGGFIVLHFALSHKTKELKAAGWVLVIGGIISLFLASMGGMHHMKGGSCGKEKACCCQKNGGMDKRSQCPMMMGKHKPDMNNDGKMVLEAPPPPVSTPAN